VIPPFQPDGNLPPGLHPATWGEFSSRFGSTARRLVLLEGLRRALDALKTAGCRTAYIDGSFVTAKRAPGDFDGCWDVAGVDPALLDPVLLRFDQGRAEQKAKYGGELFPAQLPNGLSGKTFLEFFQIDKHSGHAKGIVVIDLSDLLP
jgi:hypothetical protein